MRSIGVSQKPSVRVIVISAAIAVAALIPSTLVAGDKVDAVSTDTATQLVQGAAEAAKSGIVARQFALLREASRARPGFELPRWQLGQIEVDGEWLAVEEAQRRADANPKQALYRQRRQELGDGSHAQLELARWCRKNGLREEAKFHWYSALSTAPDHEEALRALGLRWFEGQLLTYEQVAENKLKARLAQRAFEKWQPQVKKWERALANEGAAAEKALSAIREISDPESIPVLEALTLNQEAKNTDVAERQGGVGLAFLAALGDMPDQRATESLVRHAVLSPQSDVRADAAERLRYRPPHDYVPLLLSGLAPKTETWFHVRTYGDGSVHYRHTLYREGSEAKWTFNLARSSLQHDMQGHTFVRDRDGSIRDLGRHRDSPAQVAAKMATVAVSSVRKYGEEAALVEQQVAIENQVAEINNERVTHVLATTTGETFGNDPKAWSDWWQDYNEYYSDGETPTYEQNYVDNRYYYYRMPEVAQPMSCFAKGTLVWTKTGQRPIESLELGDLVLAQDVDTGELAYKPVIGRTVRPPSEILKLTIGEEAVLTTRGHPFWVAGVGWRMAKELGEGAVLYAVTGAARIDAVHSTGEAEAYNLVVADFNTYFVGESGVLVHDNTPRKPTLAMVPGLAAK